MGAMKKKETEAKPAAAEKKSKPLRYAILLLLVLVLTNPGLLFFLPEELRKSLTGAVSGLLGDVSQISRVVHINWITIFQLVVMLLALLFLYNVCQLLLAKLKPAGQRTATLVTVISSAARYAVVLAAVFWGLAIIGVNVSTIFASLGVLALIIGFGAESLIADVVTGVFILIENQYQVGDIVEVNGFRGTVSAITIRTTCVTDAGDNTKIFNNSDMRNIINLSNKPSMAMSEIAVGYEADLYKLRAAMDTILPAIQQRHPEVFGETPIYLGVQELADSGIVLRVIAHVEEKKRFSAARLLNEELKMTLEKAGFPAPFPQVDVHMKG